MTARRLAAALALGAVALAAASASGGRGPWIERLDPRLDALIPPGTRVEQLASGFAWVEGPVWDPRQGALLFSDIPRNAVLRWREGEGARVWLERSGYAGAEPFAGREPGSNGLALDAGGRLVLCEHGNRRITRLEGDGSRTVLVDRYRGRRLNSPNDLVFRGNGDLYFTDPPFGLPGAFDDPGRELDFSGVYRLASGGELTLLTGEIAAPNGIAFSPDEGRLYVTDVAPESAAWRVYPVRADGSLGPGAVLVDARPFTRERPGGPDGLVADRAGNLFAAGPGGLYVFAPSGAHLGTVRLGVATSNCAWGEDGSTLFITADRALYRIRGVTTGGQAWILNSAGRETRPAPDSRNQA